MSSDSDSEETVNKSPVAEYGQYENADDLEKALVIAAADADARNNAPHVETETKLEDCPTRKDDYVSKKREIEDCIPAKRTKQNDGKAYVSEVVAQHYNTLEEKGLDERSKSRIVHLRNFHNWIKSMLINEYLSKIKNRKKHNEPLRVLDIGCGKGGDLQKWKKANITHLICCDIASVSLDQCKSRYEDMKSRNYRDRYPSNVFSIEYIAADCTRVRLREKYKDVTMKLDLVSCQFAFHYSFESLTQAECMMRNASECLQPGGYFIGTILDANDLIARARKLGSNSYGNDVYKVIFHCNTNKPPLFGAKYNFHLEGRVDCPEFLVHFGTFIKLAKKYGLKLAKKEKFYAYYERMKDEGKNLLVNMRSLEAYPPPQGVAPVGTAPDDYTHAEEFLKAEGSNQKIGTLSKSEWEASCKYFLFKYLLFVFYKLRSENL